MGQVGITILVCRVQLPGMPQLEVLRTMNHLEEVMKIVNCSNPEQ